MTRNSIECVAFDFWLLAFRRKANGTDIGYLFHCMCMPHSMRIHLETPALQKAKCFAR
jgi:hypothetical protein